MPSCAKFDPDRDRPRPPKPVTSTFGALGGVRTPNLLIRSRFVIVPEGLKTSRIVPFSLVGRPRHGRSWAEMGRLATWRDSLVGCDVGLSSPTRA